MVKGDPKGIRVAARQQLSSSVLLGDRTGFSAFLVALPVLRFWRLVPESELELFPPHLKHMYYLEALIVDRSLV